MSKLKKYKGFVMEFESFRPMSQKEKISFSRSFSHFKRYKNPDYRILKNISYGMRDISIYFEKSPNVKVINVNGWIIRVKKDDKIQTNCPFLKYLMNSILKQIDAEMQQIKQNKELHNATSYSYSSKMA